ncbi:MAG: alcohol dehydrogenase catalytic domain-containing protein [Atribacterota bacterium]
MMRALLKVEENPGFVLQDIPIPSPGKREILVRVRAAAICGSDLKIYKWDEFARSIIPRLPFIPGHECCGEVVALGEGVEGFRVGDKVASETHIPCLQCFQCRHGRLHTCENMGLFGHTRNGCFAEYAVIPAVSTRKIPESFSFDEGCMLEPMGIPYRAVEAGNVTGDFVVVLGCGPIGQFAVAFARFFGAAQIIAVDPNEKRLRIASSMGAHFLVNPCLEPLVEVVAEKARDFGGGVGVVIEASGNILALQEAFRYLRVGGKIMVLGQTAQLLGLHVSPDIVFKEVTIQGFFGRKIWDTWEKIEALMESGKIDIAPVITHRFTLSQYEEAFRTALHGEGCKVVFDI